MTSKSSALAALPLPTLLKTVTPLIHEAAGVRIFLSHFLTIMNVSNRLDINLLLPLIIITVTGIVQIPDPALAQDRIQDLLALPVTILLTIVITINPLHPRNPQSLTAK